MNFINFKGKKIFLYLFDRNFKIREKRFIQNCNSKNKYYR